MIMFVRTQSVTTSNNVGFACKKAQTISFVERGFERLGLGHQTVGFSWYPYIVKSPSPLESFSWRRAGRLWFLAIFPSPLFWRTHLYIIWSFLVDPSPPLVSRVGAYFCIHPINRPLLLSASREDWSYTVQVSFLINQIWTLAGAFNAEGVHFPWPNFAPCFPVGPIPLTSPSGGYLGIAFTKTLIFPLKSWSAEDRVVLSRSPWHLGLRSFVLGTRHPRHGPWAQIEFGPDCKLPGPTISILVWSLNTKLV